MISRTFLLAAAALLAITAAFVILLVLPAYTEAVTPAPQPLRYAPMTFLISNNTRGWHFPSPPGGRPLPGTFSTPQRNTLFKWLNNRGRNVLAIDCGNLSSGFSPASNQDEGRMDFTVLDLLGYTCALMGTDDLETGFDAFASKTSATEVPVICANLYDAMDRKPLSKQYCLVDLDDGLRIGFTGLLGASSQERLPEDVKQRVHISDPCLAFNEIRKELKRSGAQMIVILTNMTIIEFFHLHERCGDYMDLVVGVREESIPYPMAWREGKTVVAHVPESASSIGKLTIIYRNYGVLSFDLESIPVDEHLQMDVRNLNRLIARQNKADRWMAEIIYPEVLTRRLKVFDQLKSPEKMAAIAAKAVCHHTSSWIGLSSPDFFAAVIPHSDYPLRRADVYATFVEPQRCVVVSFSVAWEARDRVMKIFSPYTISPPSRHRRHPYPENRTWEHLTVAMPESMVPDIKEKLLVDPFVKDVKVEFRSFHDIREVVTCYMGTALPSKVPLKRGVRSWR